MTAPARRSNTRAVLAAALVGLAIGALVFFLSRGDDPAANKGSGAPLVPSSLPSSQPSSQPSRLSNDSVTGRVKQSSFARVNGGRAPGPYRQR